MSKTLRKIRERAVATCTFKKPTRTSEEDIDFQLFGVGAYDQSNEGAYIVASSPSDEDSSQNGDTSSISTDSTNATADDLPGPGRLLDKYIYQRGGRVIERFLMRRTMATMHPAIIVHYLSPSPTVWKRVLEGCPPESIISVIELSRGFTVVTGLKSLVQQTQ